jgi:hypothetical protein
LLPSRACPGGSGPVLLRHLMRIQPASQLARRAVTWLWPGRLALGKLAMLDGDPGLGKSLLTLDLCARLSTGRPLPDGSAGPGSPMPSSSTARTAAATRWFLSRLVFAPGLEQSFQPLDLGVALRLRRDQPGELRAGRALVNAQAPGLRA